jgi:hypothetical protein
MKQELRWDVRSSVRPLASHTGSKPMLRPLLFANLIVIADGLIVHLKAVSLEGTFLEERTKSFIRAK